VAIATRSAKRWNRTVPVACALALVAFLGIGASSALAAGAPVVSEEAATEVGVTTVKLTGKVNPEGASGEPSATTWRLQYSPVGTDHGAEGNENWNFGNEGFIESEEANDAEVEAVFGFGGELQPGQEYEFRLQAENASGSDATEAPYPSFTTDEATAPALATKKTTPIGYSSANLHGTVNPQGGNVNPIGGPLGINWELQYREVGQLSWNSAGGGEISGAEAEEEKALPITAELGPGSLVAGHSYEVRVFAYYLNFSRETVSPPIPAETFTTKAATAPSATEPLASAITGTGAHFAGEVDTNAPTPGSPEEEADIHVAFDSLCTFDYVADAQFQIDGFTSAQQIGCEPNPVSGTGPTPVSADPTELKPHTTYHLRLRAENQGGQSTATAASTFTTEAVAPTVGHTFVSSVGTEDATLNAQVNPGGAPTTFHFEYVTQAHFEAEEFIGATSTTETPLGAEDNAEHVASTSIEGLDPDATYRFKAIATNAKGSTEGEARWFHTHPLAGEEPTSCPNAGEPGVGFLPDCRAWEMVSPPDKAGGDVIVNTARIRAAADGSALQFSSLVAFGDAVGTGVAVDYMAIRSPDPTPGDSGWATHAITPPQQPLAYNVVTAAEPHYSGDLSADLSRGVFRAWSPLTDVPDVAKAANLYVRTDLRTPGAGSYQLVTQCPLCATTGPLPEISSANQTPLLGGASADFTHIAFESTLNLTEGPSGFGPRAYEWDEGQLRYAGYIPSEPAIISCGGAGPACVAAAVSKPGQGVGTLQTASRPVNVVSDDGSRVFFTVPTNGSGNVFAFARFGRIYVRTDGTTTDEISASERTDCAITNPGESPKAPPDCTGAPAPDPYQTSEYWGASRDGSRVFFTTPRALTDDAAAGVGTQLYMYDTTKPASDPHNLTLLNVDRELADPGSVGTVMVISDDGHYVYFIANGQLVAGQPVLDTNRGFYMWHDGEVAFIGRNVVGEPGEIATGGSYELGPPQVRTTPDGRFLLLSSHDGSGFSLGYDHGDTCTETTNKGCRELYLYSAETHSLACASCDPGGVPPTTDASSSIRPLGTATTTWHLNHALTDDGRFVFFTSGEALLPGDTNGVLDAYSYDVEAGHLHLLSSGTDPSPSYFVEASSDGSDAFFITRQRLSAWDKDSSRDVYDARIDGGFPEPPPTKAPCNGDSCRVGIPSPPPTAPSSSADLTGPGDPPVRRGCPRGKHAVKKRGKTRCVKPRRHHARTANRNRRNGR
jgi:hypothetical protein